MKKVLLIIITMLYCQQVFSQRQFLPEKETPRRSQINIPLPNRNRMVIGYNSWGELNVHGNIDSLLHLFLTDYHQLNDTVKKARENQTIRYRIESNGHRTLSFAFRPTQDEPYQFVGNDLQQSDGEADTLIVEKKIQTSNRHGLPGDLRFYLIFNSLDELKTLTGTLNERIEKARKLAASHPKKDLFKPRYQSYINLDSTARYPILAADYWKLGKIIQPGVGVGITKNQFYTALLGDVGLVPGRSRVGLRIGWHEYFFFDNQPDGNFTIHRNSFLNAGLLFFRPWRLTSELPASSSRGSLVVGYLVRNRGDYFADNTWRLAVGMTALQRLRIEPELYWNGFFKQVYPGVRLNVSF
ncbi:MAG: hypothetical protein H7Z75_04150 [Ferruginibacter sp.]|nr:hypothetical protein [Cytophagales bacterium]